MGKGGGELSSLLEANEIGEDQVETHVLSDSQVQKECEQEKTHEKTKRRLETSQRSKSLILKIESVKISHKIIKDNS